MLLRRKPIFHLFVQARSKVSLRNLSMILRQEEVASAEQRLENIKQGVAYAKEAVQLDTSDGISWTVLGTAYLSSFFSQSQNPHTLKLCMSAYQQAVSYLKSHDRNDVWCMIDLTAIGLTPGGSSTVHIYTQTVHRTTQWDRIHRMEHT
jgi:hypothetical protein